MYVCMSPSLHKAKNDYASVSLILHTHLFKSKTQLHNSYSVYCVRGKAKTKFVSGFLYVARAWHTSSQRQNMFLPERCHDTARQTPLPGTRTRTTLLLQKLPGSCLAASPLTVAAQAERTLPVRACVYMYARMCMCVCVCVCACVCVPCAITCALFVCV